MISTVAGNGALGAIGDGGPAPDAEIGNPFGLAIGADGSVYIADRSNHVVRRVGPDGIISTVAGIPPQEPGGGPGFAGDGGPATAALLNQPLRLAIGSDGSLFIGDGGNRAIRRVSPSQAISTIAGQGQTGFAGDGGPAGAALLGVPTGVAVSADG
jgi:serine/threonine-protein kinase